MHATEQRLAAPGELRWPSVYDPPFSALYVNKLGPNSQQTFRMLSVTMVTWWGKMAHSMEGGPTPMYYRFLILRLHLHYSLDLKGLHTGD